MPSTQPFRLSEQSEPFFTSKSRQSDAVSASAAFPLHATSFLSSSPCQRRPSALSRSSSTASSSSSSTPCADLAVGVGDVHHEVAPMRRSGGHAGSGIPKMILVPLTVSASADVPDVAACSFDMEDDEEDSFTDFCHDDDRDDEADCEGDDYAGPHLCLFGDSFMENYMDDDDDELLQSTSKGNTCALVENDIRAAESSPSNKIVSSGLPSLPQSLGQSSASGCYSDPLPCRLDVSSPESLSRNSAAAFGRPQQQPRLVNSAGARMMRELFGSISKRFPHCPQQQRREPSDRGTISSKRALPFGVVILSGNKLGCNRRKVQCSLEDEVRCMKQ